MAGTRALEGETLSEAQLFICLVGSLPTPPPPQPGLLLFVCGGTQAVQGSAESLVPGLAQCRCPESVCWGRQTDKVSGGSG